jgi:hypothetical protein
MLSEKGGHDAISRRLIIVPSFSSKPPISCIAMPPSA